MRSAISSSRARSIADSRVDLVKSPIGDRGQIGGAEAGHQFGRRGQARAAGGENDRLFRQRQRRLCLDRDVRKARHCRRDEGQGAEEFRRRRSVKSSRRRRRDRLSADQRTDAGIRHRHRRPAAGRACRRSRCSRPGSPPCSKEPDAGKALIKFLASPAAAPRSSRAAWIRSQRRDELAHDPTVDTGQHAHPLAKARWWCTQLRLSAPPRIAAARSLPTESMPERHCRPSVHFIASDRRILQAVIVIGLAQRAVRRRLGHEFGCKGQRQRMIRAAPPPRSRSA